MKCPKCDFDIDEKMLVCPNCKKVLKLVCPKCKTINQGNICKKCGFSIISKCHQCGKVNQTISGKCTKCGFNTYTSVAINTSNIDEFACITIDFPNLNDIKSALGSTKLYEKFKINLDRLVYNFAFENDLQRELLDESYVIKFNKDMSFSDSANNAIKGAIEILNSVTEMNFKLNKLKNILLQCNIAVLKRDIKSQPDDFTSGFDIKMIYQGKDQSKLLSGLQVITDASIYETVCDNYELNTLSSTFVKNQMVMFFELNIKKYVKIPKEEEKQEEIYDLPSLPTFDEELSQDQSEIYNIDAINFDELKFNFINAESANIIEKVLEKLQENPLNAIAIRASKNLMPRTLDLMEGIESLQKYSNIFKVTCHDSLKYEPYGFFKELISAVCNFSKAPRNFPLHTFEMFEAIDSSNYMYNLINSQKREGVNSEESRKILFDIFFNIFSSIQGSLIVIEDLDKIDDSSFEILQLFFEKFEDFQISYVTTASKDFSLHKNAHFLLSNPYYTEVIVKPSNIKEILLTNTKKYKNLVESFYLQKIAQVFRGSLLYFENVIDYLIDIESLTLEADGILGVNPSKSIFIPPTLEDLASKRITFLLKETESYKLFAMLLLIGPRVDLNTIELLEIPEVQKELENLIKKNFIYISNESIFINNYNLYKDCLINSAGHIELKKQIAQALLDKVFDIDSPTSTDPILYNMLENPENEFKSWQNLAQVCNSLGDFSAYVNCSNKFLSLADKNLSEGEADYKKEIYNNISTLMHKYSPEKQQGILQEILNNFEQTEDNEKIITLFNKMLQGYLLNGHYMQAFNSICKIFAKFPHFSINPNNENFNIAFFFMSLIKIEILFSIGNFKDCIDAANEILSIINAENLNKLKPAHLSIDKFEDTIFDALYFAAFAKVLVLDKDFDSFKNTINSKMGKLPNVFELFTLLNEVIHGNKIQSIPSSISTDEDRFSKILLNIITAFNDYKDNYEKFAGYIHQAKVNAKAYCLFQIELACDILIGYSYFRLNKTKKAASIYNNVFESSEKCGIKTVSQLAWYLISMMKYEEGSYEIAAEIANNAIVKIEKDENSGDFLFFLFKILLAKILLAKNAVEISKLCIDNANLIKQNYKLNFNTQIDFDNITKKEQDTQASIQEDITQEQPEEVSEEGYEEQYKEEISYEEASYDEDINMDSTNE